MSSITFSFIQAQQPQYPSKYSIFANDIDLVLDQSPKWATKAMAKRVLEYTKGDVVDAILTLLNMYVSNKSQFIPPK